MMRLGINPILGARRGIYIPPSNSPLLLRYQPGISYTSLGGTYSGASAKTYVDQNGIVQTMAGGSLREWRHYINGVPTTLLEGQSTNSALWGRDLTNAAWVKSSATVAKDQTGVDGVANSASSFLATGATAFVQQGIALTGSRTFSVWLKRLVGSGTVRISINGGSTYTTTVLTGAWQRFSVSDPAAVSHNIVISIVTSGDSIAVDYAQDEALAFPSSSIATTSAAVTRSADSLMLPITFNPAALTFYVKYVALGGTDSFDSPYVLLLSQANDFAPSVGFLRPSSAPSGNGFRYSNVGNAAAAVNSTYAVNDTIERRGVLASTGNTSYGESVNGGVESTNGPSAGAAGGLAGAWSQNKLWIGSNGIGAGAGLYAFQSVKIASAVQSLATMRGF